MANEDDDDDLSVDWGAALAEDHNAPSLDDDMDMAAALAQIEAEEAEQKAGGGSKSPKSIGEGMGLDEHMEAVYDVEISVRAVLGMTDMPMSQILKLGRGAVVELDRGVGDPIDIYSADQKVAQGEVVVVEDKLAISIQDIMRSRRSR